MSEHALDFADGNGRLRFERYYNSNPRNPNNGSLGWKDGYTARHIYSIDQGTKTAVPRPGVAAATVSSAAYASAAAACVSGVADLASGFGGASGNPAFAGMTGTYVGNGQCQLSNGTVIPVFNTNGALAYSSPVTDASAGFSAFRPDGSSYFFSCFNGTCTAIGQSQVSLMVSSSGYTLTVENGDIETYDLNGALVSIVSRDGYTQRLTYTRSGVLYSLNSVIDSFGRTLTFGYNTNSLLSQLTLPDGKTVQYGYDTSGHLTGVTYADGRTIGYQYSNTNFPQALTAWVDESNATYATWSYDTTTGMAITSALAGNVDTSTLSYNGNATTLTDNLGTQRIYNYQSVAGGTRLVSVSGPVCRDCMGQSMTYDANGFLKSSQDWNGVTTHYTYDAKGLLQQRVDGVGNAAQRTTNITWNAALRVPLTRTVNDASSQLVASSGWVYNSAGQTLARCEIDTSVASGYTCAATGTTPAGVRRWTYTYCTAVDSTQCPIIGLLLSVTGPRTDLAQTATYSYYLTSSAVSCGTPGAACYQAGDLHTVTDALGHVTTIASYDGAGRITRTTDANGVNTDLTYTPRGWLASRSVGGATTNFTYTPYGAVASITDPDNVTTSTTYDAAHRLTRVSDALGNYVQYTLDAAGNKTAAQVYDSGGTLRKSLSRSYNTLGQLTGLTDGLSHTVFNASFTDSYDANGNLVHSADALGIQRKQGYDGLNRLISTLDNYNGTDSATQNTQSVFAYDARDQLLGVGDPDGLNTTYDYDGLSNPKAVHSPDTGTTAYVVDAAGNRAQQTDAKGNVSTSSYDALNRRLATTYTDPTLNVSYSYDEANSVTGCSSSSPLGRLTRVIENAVTTVFCYDARGNVIQKRQVQSTQTDVTQYSYTLGDRLSSVIAPSTTATQYTRDGAGRITTVTVTPPGTAAGTVVSGITYLPFGPIASYTLGNGQTVTRSYDANYALTDVVSPALNLHFARDAMGNPTALGNAPGANPAIESYSYDPLYRLTGVNNASGAAIEAYTYSKTGDRLSKTASGLATGSYGYQSGTHWLTSIGSSARTYDANGNTTGSATGGDTYGYGYNGRNRMTVVQRNGQTVATYSYNALGQRIAKTVTFPQAVSQRFAYDEASRLIGEYGTVNRDYIWLDDLPVAVVDTTGITSTVSYVHADGLNTPRAITDATGAAIWQWAYQGNPFGEQQPTSSTGYTFNLRFPGQYFDAESGLLHNGYRDYEAARGGYGQADPMGPAGGPNPYSYVSNSPLNRFDALGLADVYIWKYRGSVGEDKGWGHASLDADGGRVHISWWPQADGRDFLIPGIPIYEVPANTDQTLARDRELEDHKPDMVIHLDNLDEAAIASWWADFKKTHKWKTLSQNCSTTVAQALRAGGADKHVIGYPKPMVWNPEDVVRYATAIQQAGQGQVYYTPGTPGIHEW
ncbi:RHS repeat domain-containing protein [Dyella subtropica]|uniref:RHS repeat domain-containing protein n=1 Tax=Dyella subtropica TaxID=2992127 RepID=UPI00224E95BC|nr:RHS repeat-associated core domain-containing protein [Dyella subtropica]